MSILIHLLWDTVLRLSLSQGILEFNETQTSQIGKDDMLVLANFGKS